MNTFNKENSFGKKMAAILQHKALSRYTAHSFHNFHLDSEISCKHCQLCYKRFYTECRKVIGFTSLSYTIGLKNSRHFFIQSEVKPKPIVTRSRTFSRALHLLRVIISSFDWFTVFAMSFVIGYSDDFGLCLTTLH